jgi:competence protein ComGC
MALLFISSMVMSFYITNTDISSTLPYSMAAVLVLLPISLICEFLYRKREPTKKVGASSVIMIIHAVLFALFGVGALVVIVLNAVKLFISGSTLENTSAQVFMYVAGIMFVVFAVLFFRTVIPANLLKFRLVISLFMVAVSISLIAVAAIGPVNREIQTKNDKLIEDNLSYVVSAVEQYYVENNKLPDSLSNITLRGDAAKLQSEKLVSYINETSSGPTKYSGLKYQLCVNYVKADEEINPYMQYDYPKNSSDGYSSYANTYGHAAGKVCYKLTTGSSPIGL